MTTITATEARARFGEFMKAARHEPVVVSKSGRPYVVMVSAEEHDRLQSLDDMVWSQRAAEAEASGFIGTAAAAALLERAAERA